MATYENRTWETLNLPAVSGDTFFTIFNRETLYPGDDFNGRIYSGLCKDGYGIKNVNEILAQYVIPRQFDFTPVAAHQDDVSHSTFYIYYTQDDWETFTSDTVTLTYDWSYENDNRIVKSNPIINLLDYRQYLLYTITATDPNISEIIDVKLNNNLIDTFKIDGYTFYTYIRDLSQLTYPGEFTYAYSYDFLVDRAFPFPGTYNTLTIGASKYLITNTCYRYCLYYLNQYGGWDSMLFRGKELQTDDLSRLSYKKNYVANSTEFHKVDYLTTINEKWQLNTSFLDDLSSSKIINIMGSNRLFLHDLETGHIAPVNVTNSSCEHKTYKNQSRKMATYNVEVTASQPKYRI